MIVQVVVPFSNYSCRHLPTSSEIENEREVTRLRIKTMSVEPTIKYGLAVFRRSQRAGVLSSTQ